MVIFCRGVPGTCGNGYKYGCLRKLSENGGVSSQPQLEFILMIFDFPNNSASDGVPLTFSKNALGKTLIFIFQITPGSVFAAFSAGWGKAAQNHSEWQTAAVFSAAYPNSD